MPTVRPAITSPVSHPKSNREVRDLGESNGKGLTVVGNPSKDGEETDGIGLELEPKKPASVKSAKKHGNPYPRCWAVENLGHIANTGGDGDIGFWIANNPFS